MNKRKDFPPIIKDASNKVNATFLIFTLFNFYILLVISNTSDLDLFITGSTITIPVIQYKLNLIQFSYFSGFILCLLQLNLYLTIKQFNHIKKTYALSDISVSKTITPHLINRIDKGSNFLKILLLCFLPMITLFSMYIRFLPYHSINLSSFHFILLITTIILGNLSIKPIIKTNLKKFLLSFPIVIIILSIPLIILQNFDSFLEKTFANSNSPLIPFQKYLTLNIINVKFSLENIRKHYGNQLIRFNFDHRDLRGLNFSKSTINSASFNYTNLKYTNFQSANIKNSNLTYSKLYKSYFLKADLSNSTFLAPIDVYQDGLTTATVLLMKGNLKDCNFGKAILTNVTFPVLQDLKSCNLDFSTLNNTTVYINQQLLPIEQVLKITNFIQGQGR